MLPSRHNAQKHLSFWVVQTYFMVAVADSGDVGGFRFRPPVVKQWLEISYFQLRSFQLLQCLGF